MQHEPTCEPDPTWPANEDLPPSSSLALPTAAVAGQFVFSLLGLREYLQREQIRVLSVVRDLGQLGNEVQRTHPDLVFLDLFSASEEELSVVDQLVGYWPAPKVVVFTTTSSPEHVLSILRSGASAIILKGQPMALPLKILVKQVLSGGMVVDPAILARFLRSIDWPSLRLTTREQRLALRLSEEDRALLRALTSGSSLSSIAEEYMLASGTVRNRLSKIYRVLGVRNRFEAIAFVSRVGLPE